MTTTRGRILLGIFTLLISNGDYSWAAPSVKELATRVSTGLGKVSQTYEGHKGQVIIFEERHNSIATQIEIAHMLLRLHQKYSMKYVGLEGAFSADGRLQSKWADNLKGKSKIETIAELLAEAD